MYSPFVINIFYQLSAKKSFSLIKVLILAGKKNWFKLFLTCGFEVKVHPFKKEIETSNCSKLPSLSNMVGVVADSIQAAIAFAEL